MRLGLFLLFAMLLLAIVAGQSILLQSAVVNAKSTTSASPTCAVQGGACPQPSPDSASDVVLAHAVYVSGCFQADLHVVRYVPAGSPDSKPVVATWFA